MPRENQEIIGISYFNIALPESQPRTTTCPNLRSNGGLGKNFRLSQLKSWGFHRLISNRVAAFYELQVTAKAAAMIGGWCLAVKHRIQYISSGVADFYVWLAALISRWDSRFGGCRLLKHPDIAPDLHMGYVDYFISNS